VQATVQQVRLKGGLIHFVDKPTDYHGGRTQTTVNGPIQVERSQAEGDTKQNEQFLREKEND
jgi:hypothetical protein